MLALAIGLGVFAGLVRAEGPKQPPSNPQEFLKALEEAGKPGPEHKKLQPLVGDWDLTVKLWVDPSQPPAEAKGTVTRKWILGGRFVQESVHVECGGKSFEGLGLVGYDSAQKKFTVVKACGLCGTVSHGLATCSAAGDRFECVKEECCPVTGQKVKGRDEVLIEGPDRIVVNVFKTINDREVRVMQIVTTRKK
jgi:hypothetical protein